MGDRIQAGQTIGTMGNTGFVLDINGNVPSQEQLRGGVGSHLDVTMWNTFEDAGVTKEQAIASLDLDADVDATVAGAQPIAPETAIAQEEFEIPEFVRQTVDFLEGRESLSGFNDRLAKIVDLDWPKIPEYAVIEIEINRVPTLAVHWCLDCAKRMAQRTNTTKRGASGEVN